MSLCCDSSYRYGDGVGGCGFVLRTHTGDFMRGGAFKGKGIDAFVSEIFAVKKALEMVRDMKLGAREICVQSDSKNVVSVLQKKNGSSKVAACIHEIAKELGKVTFVFIFREMNCAVNFLATMSMDPGLQYFTPDAMPEQLRSILHEERIGVKTPRIRE